jgi:hypothetical protein
LKSGIPYENGGPVALCINESVVVVNDGIGPLPEVEGVETIVVQTDKGGLGGNIPPVVVAEQEYEDS